MTDTPSQPAATRLPTLLNTLIVAGGYFLSRMLGLVREIIISAQFGTTAQLDAFRATFNVIDMIYLVVAGGALGTAFIPVFAGMLEKKHEEEAWRLANATLQLALIGLIGASLLIGLFADPIVAATVGRGFEAETRALTVVLLRWMLIQPILLGIGGIVKSILESHHQFGIPALGANVYNLGIIAGALLAPWFGVWSLVGGVLLGAAAFILIQLPHLFALGARPRRHLWLATAGVRDVLRLLGPRLFGQAVWQINLLAIASFASLAGVGALAANGFAMQLMLLPHGLLALSVGTVIFPELARRHASGDTSGFRQQALGAVRTVLFLAIPAALMLGVLAEPIVRLLFQRGAFDVTSTALTSQALVAYMAGLAAFAAAEILVRTFYAMQDTRTPVWIACVAVLLNIGLGYFFLQTGSGLAGLAMAFSIANLVESGLLLAILAQRLGGFAMQFWRAVGSMLLAGLACLAVLIWLPQLPTIQEPFASGLGYQWPNDFVRQLAWVAIITMVGLGVYAGAAVALRIPEASMMLERIRRLRR
jgi:putative peptidoglycan lipid II flippase